MFRLSAWLLLFPLALSSVLASNYFDQKHSYKNIAAAIANASREPVMGDQVESEMLTLLRREGRFEFSESGYETLKKGLTTLALPPMKSDDEAVFKSLNPVFDAMAKQGVPSIILGDIIRAKDAATVQMHLLTTTDGKKVFSATVDVLDSKSLESYTAAASEAVTKVLRGIPFEASVIKRDGYRVILDRGFEIFRVGMELSLYTIEEKDGQLVFDETGKIQITQADRALSFGKIMAENRPREIGAGNKVRMQDLNLPTLSVPLLSQSDDRSPASHQEVFETTKGKLGLVSASLGPSIFKLSSTSKASSSAAAVEKGGALLSPGGNLRAELWLTSKYYAEMALGYGFAQYTEEGTATVASQRVGSTISDFKFLAGYRLNIFAPQTGPIIRFQLGYGSDSYSFGEVTGVTPSHREVSYSGLMIGGGVQFGVYERFSGAFDVHTLIFPSVSSSALTSSQSVSGVSAWDMAFRCIYDYARDLDFEAKLLFQRNGAEFSGDSGLVGTTQFSIGALAGVSYYF